MTTRTLPIALVLAGLLLGLSAAPAPMKFTDVRGQSAEFVGYWKSIALTPEQEAVKKAALEALPAPCCSDNTAYTCCCPCNLSKTTWGLANYLIAKRGYDAEQVKTAAAEWIKFVNPTGFSGKGCYTGMCPKPFAQGGCGGMKEPVQF